MASHSQSKRTTLRKKYKIRRKVREHHRKVRKAEKSSGRKRKSEVSEAKVPNNWPFKKEVLEEMERERERTAQEKARRKEERRAKRAETMEDLAARAAKEGTQFAEADEIEVDEPDRADPGLVKETSRKAFMKEFNKVIETADVILEVLDARDPLGCRCLDAEKKVMAAKGGARKRIVLVLNKVDLVPKEVVQKWLTFLRHEFPTIAFRSSLQDQKSSLSHGEGDVMNASTLSTSECLGAETLTQLLKNYCRSHNIKTSIAVGVIGFPNVGKSSLINSLKRSKAVSTGSMPGLTRSVQEVQVDKNIRLIDCPGIVFSSRNDDALILRNCIKIEQLEDPIAPVEAILRRCGEEALMSAYALPEFSGVSELLALVAKKRGKLKRGGGFNADAAARTVLQDWNSGRIAFYTVPPEVGRARSVSTKVVKQWSADFQLENLQSREQDELDRAFEALNVRKEANYVRAEASLPVELGEEAEDVTMDDAGEETQYKIARGREKSASGKAKNASDEPMEVDGERQAERLKKQQKKRKKEAKRAKAAAMDDDGDFDFGVFEQGDNGPRE